MWCTLSMFLDSIKLGAEAGVLEGRIPLQRGLVRHEKRADRISRTLESSKAKSWEKAPQQHPAEMGNSYPGVIQPDNLLIWSQTCCPCATRSIWRDAAPRHGPSLGGGDMVPMGTTPELPTTAPRRPRPEPNPYKLGIAAESPVGQVRCFPCLSLSLEPTGTSLRQLKTYLLSLYYHALVTAPSFLHSFPLSLSPSYLHQ